MTRTPANKNAGFGGRCQDTGRRVYRVAVVYAAVAFVIWQAAEIAFPALNLPEWALTLVVVLTLNQLTTCVRALVQFLLR